MGNGLKCHVERSADTDVVTSTSSVVFRLTVIALKCLSTFLFPFVGIVGKAVCCRSYPDPPLLHHLTLPFSFESVSKLLPQEPT